MATRADWDPTIQQDVAARYDQMRDQRERCPMARASRHGGQWDVLRYADVVEAASDPDRFSNGLQSRYAKPMPPLEYDPPDHRDYRRMLAVFFTPKRMAMLEPVIRQNARALLAPMLTAGRGDLAQGYSYPLPALGLCALLNIDGGSWGQIKEWSEHTLLKDSEDPEEEAMADASHALIIEYAHGMIADRRARPRHPEEDIASALLAARVGGKAMDDDTIARTLRILISAGHNSTTSAIGNMILYLAENPEDQTLLRREIARIPAAAEEILRAETPVQEMPRIARRDTELGGCPIKAGDRLGMFWAAANRDPEAFPDPDRIILDRKPNRHVAFGHGIHTCLGAPMARMEMRVAMEELLSATTGFTLETEAKRARFHRMGVVNLPLIPGDGEMIDEAQVDAFERDGAIILRGVIEPHWIERMRDAVDDVIANPSRLVSDMTGASGGNFHGDHFLWRHHPDFRAFMMEAPMSRIAQQMMRTRKVNFFYEQLLVKEPGTGARTPWHQDLPYWPVGGWQVVSIWVPFDRATPDNGAVTYVKGSHKWGKLYRPRSFGSAPRAQSVETEHLEEAPDIEARPQDFEFITGILEPGDVFVHHARTLHGAPGNASTHQRRRALATRWTGDDAYFEDRPGNFLKGDKFAFLREFAPTESGQPMDSDLFPVILS